MDMRRYWDCGRKRGHATREAAARMAGHIRRCTKGGAILAPYRCRLCGQWHLAHRSMPAYFAYAGWGLARTP
jgi:hypothetical protein